MRPLAVRRSVCLPRPRLSHAGPRALGARMVPAWTGAGEYRRVYPERVTASTVHGVGMPRAGGRSGHTGAGAQQQNVSISIDRTLRVEKDSIGSQRAPLREEIRVHTGSRRVLSRSGGRRLAFSQVVDPRGAVRACVLCAPRVLACTQSAAALRSARVRAACRECMRRTYMCTHLHKLVACVCARECCQPESQTAPLVPYSKDTEPLQYP